MQEVGPMHHLQGLKQWPNDGVELFLRWRAVKLPGPAADGPASSERNTKVGVELASNTRVTRTMEGCSNLASVRASWRKLLRPHWKVLLWRSDLGWTLIVVSRSAK